MKLVAIAMQSLRQKITLMVAVTSCFLVAVESGKCYKDGKTTFERNGRTCDLCRPGTYMVKPCTEDAPSRCQKVPNGSYMPYFNKCTRVIVVQLWPCNRPCYGRFEVTVQNCTAVSRGKCDCIEGTYKTPGEGRCIAHVCSPGYMVSIESLTLTCRPCPQGSYSSTRNNKTRCADHTDCESLGMVTVSKGNTTHDATCEKNENEIFQPKEGESTSQDLDLTDSTALSKTVTSSTTSDIQKDDDSNIGKEQETVYENNTPYTTSVLLSKMQASENAATSSSQTASGETNDDSSNHSSAQVQLNTNNTVNEELLTSPTTPISSATSLPQETADVAQATVSDANAEQDKMHNTATSMPQTSSPDATEKTTSEIAEDSDPVDCNSTADPHWLSLVPEASSDTTTSSVVKDQTEVSVSKITDESKQLLPVNVQTPEEGTDQSIAINSNIDGDTATNSEDTQATLEGAGQTIPTSKKVEIKDKNYSTLITVIVIIVSIILLFICLISINWCYKKWHRSKSRKKSHDYQMVKHEGDDASLICLAGSEEQLLLVDFVLRPGISVEVVLTEIAQNIDRSRWQSFIRNKPCPGVTETKIQDEIYQNPRSRTECIYQCLLDWKKRSDDSNNDGMKDLVAALSNFDKKLALDIKRKYCEL